MKPKIFYLDQKNEREMFFQECSHGPEEVIITPTTICTRYYAGHLSFFKVKTAKTSHFVRFMRTPSLLVEWVREEDKQGVSFLPLLVYICSRVFHVS